MITKGYFIRSATVVQQFDTFWMGLISEQVIVNLPTPPTPEPTPEPTIPTEPPNIDIEGIYADCGDRKVCFGSPAGCLNTRDCQLFGAVIYDEGKFIFELLSSGLKIYLMISL